MKINSVLQINEETKSLMEILKKDVTKEELIVEMSQIYEVAEYYPVPALRTMGDCDIVVQKSDRLNCNKILQKLGYESIRNEDDGEWAYLKKKITPMK